MNACDKNKHAYLLLVHRNPGQVRNLLRLLDHERNELFIHIDANSSMEISDLLLEDMISPVHVYKSISVFWSDVSLTEAELFILEKALERGPFEYYHLLSGLDLPLKSQDEILDFYDRNHGKEFVEYQVPGKFVSKPYYDRIKYYHVLSKYYRMSGRIGKFLSYIFIGIEYSLVFLQWLFRVDRIPEGMEFARGSQWFDITDELARYIQAKKKWIMNQFRMTRASDESFLPLLVHNSKFKDRLYVKTFDGDMHANMRYIDWKRGDPYVFRANDFEDLASSDLLFARKFDETMDSEIIRKISNFVMEKVGSISTQKTVTCSE